MDRFHLHNVKQKMGRFNKTASVNRTLGLFYTYRLFHPFFVPFRIGFNADPWSCIHVAPKRPKSPFTKTVTLTVCVNKPLVTVEFPSGVTSTGFQHTKGELTWSHFWCSIPVPGPTHHYFYLQTKYSQSHSLRVNQPELLIINK